MPEDNTHDRTVAGGREAAEAAFAQAKHARERGRIPDAIEAAREALHHDPTYIDVHRWLAVLYEELDHLPRASMEYQELIHANKDDQEAWESLRRVDPPSAERLERLHDIAPDPFIAQRQKKIDGDLFADMGNGDEADDDEELYEDEEYDEDEDIEEDAGAGEQFTVAETAEEEVKQPASGPVPTSPVPWAFEQEAQFRQLLLARPGVDTIQTKLDDMKADYGAWDGAMVGCAHLDKSRHEHVYDLVMEIRERFDLPQLQVLIAPERRLIPTIIGGDPTMIAITTGMIAALSEAGLRFVIGRTLARLHLDDLRYDHICRVILQRSPTSITDVEEALGDLLVRVAAGWDVGIDREALIKTGKFAHAWEQRAILSADRGGLLISGDLDASCLAIAQGTARDSDKASTMKLADFINEYRGQDPQSLGTIPPKEDPIRSASYGAYRVLMLRWWANSAQYAQLTSA